MSSVIKAASDVQWIVLACEAGMGSSLMVTNALKKMVKKAKLDVKVTHSPVHDIPAAADVVVTHQGLATRVKQVAPGAAVVPFRTFLKDPALTQLVKNLANGQDVQGI
ncbi:MAG: PTS lactose transporter subunit IIB [bacterium]|nr:PTS lactose transporter subunit IIB [bacterium]MDE0602041.1 PTS lactose transporter subunit IIB [bacterium]